MLSFKQFLLLLEYRIDFLKNQFKDKLDTSHDALAQHQSSDDIIDHFANKSDPTNNKMYTNWIIGQYRKGNIRQEDHPRIHSALSNFNRYKAKLDKKNITDYGHLNDLETAIEPHLGQVASKKEEKRNIKTEGADLLHSENGVEVRHLKTEGAACEYGKGTNWCTAYTDAPNMFNRYNNQGRLYFIKGRNGNGELKKYQYHPATKQFMDEADKPINISDFVKRNPELKNVSELAGTHESLPMSQEHKNKISKDLTSRIKSGNFYIKDDIDRAIKHGYLTEKHIAILKHAMIDKFKTDEIDPANISHAKQHGYFDENIHIPALKEAFAKKILSGKDGIKKYDIDTAIRNQYFDESLHIPLLKNHLTNKIKDGNFYVGDIDQAKEHRYWNEKEHPLILKEGFGKKFSSGKFVDSEIEYAKKHGYWDEKTHVPALTQGYEKKFSGINSTENDINYAKENGYFDKEKHIPALKEGTSKRFSSGIISNNIIDAAKKHGYWDEKIHIPELKKGLIEKIKGGDVFDMNEEIALAKKHGYWDEKIHIPELKQHLKNEINSENFTLYDVDVAKKHGYLDKKEHIPLLKKWANNIFKSGNFKYYDIDHAKEYGYWNKDLHIPTLKQHLAEKIKSGNHTQDDINLAHEYGYYDETVHDPLLKNSKPKKLSPLPFNNF